LLGIVTSSKFEQEEKAKVPMLVKLPGNVILVRLKHEENARLPMLVTPSGIATLVRFEHEENARSPMVMTPPGMVTFVRLVRLANAEAPMLVTGRALDAEGKMAVGMIVAGMVTSPLVPVYKVMMRFVPPVLVV